MKRTLIALALAAAFAGPSGPALAADVGIQLNIGPPPVVYEPVPAPREGYVWAQGYWDYDNGKHVWRKGHYEKERHGEHWVQGSWDQHDGHWYLNRGHWERG